MSTDVKPYRHRFPKSSIQHAVWLYQRFTLSYRDIEELLLQRGIQVSYETIRDGLGQSRGLEPCPLASGRSLREDQRDQSAGWRAVDEHGAVLDVLLQERRDTEAAKTLFTTLLSEYVVPTTIHTDKLGSYQAAIRELPELHGATHREVISTARCNNLIEQRAGPIQVPFCPRQLHRTTRSQERSQKGFKSQERAQTFLELHARMTNLHQHTRTTVNAETRRINQRSAFQTWNEVVLLAA